MTTKDYVMPFLDSYAPWVSRGIKAAPVVAAAYHKARTHPSSTLVSHQVNRNDPDPREAAFLAKAAYDRVPVGGYTIDPELSDNFVTTYVNDKTGKATLAYAGTEAWDDNQTTWKGKIKRAIGDLHADSHIFFGNERDTQDYAHALEMGKKAVAKYGHDNVFVTGHSLGANKGTYVSSELDLKGTGFGGGWSPYDMMNHHSVFGDKWDTSKVKHYAVPGDIVSQTALFDPYMNVTPVPKPEKMKKVKDIFGNKPYEAVAGTTLTETASAIPYAGPVVAAGLTGYGTYKLGKGLYGLHESSNFTVGSSPKDDAIYTTPKKGVSFSPHHGVISHKPPGDDDIPLTSADSSMGDGRDVDMGIGPHGDRDLIYGSDAYPISYGPYPSGTSTPFYYNGIRSKPRRRYYYRKRRRYRRQYAPSPLSRYVGGS